MSPYQDLYFCALNKLQDEILPVQSHWRLKAQIITIVTVNSNRDKFFKMMQFRTVSGEANIILP